MMVHLNTKVTTAPAKKVVVVVILIVVGSMIWYVGCNDGPTLPLSLPYPPTPPTTR